MRPFRRDYGCFSFFAARDTQSAASLFSAACVVIKRLPVDVTAVEAGKDVAGWSANPSRNMRHEFQYATAAVARAVGGGRVRLHSRSPRDVSGRKPHKAGAQTPSDVGTGMKRDRGVRVAVRAMPPCNCHMHSRECIKRGVFFQPREARADGPSADPPSWVTYPTLSRLSDGIK
jgi:hypothetical protein